MRDIIFLVDNGHGYDTPGKCSPDKTFKEWEFNRIIAREVVSILRSNGIVAELLVPENHDVSLGERVNRVNKWCKAEGKNNVVLISIHVNAAKNGVWANARGWSCFTSKGLTKSDTLATCLYAAAEKEMPDKTFRKDYSDGDPDWEENFYILKHTLCAAVLSENFFMDNKEDLKFLTSEEGKKAIVNTHVLGVLKYIEKLSKSM